jgi:hypothetical protein
MGLEFAAGLGAQRVQHELGLVFRATSEGSVRGLRGDWGDG